MGSGKLLAVRGRVSERPYRSQRKRAQRFDPTRGIDVGTKRQIYALLRRLADDGAGILFFSSELAEFPLVCDRVVTLFGGRITAELAGEGADEASLLRAMHGLVEEVAV